MKTRVIVWTVVAVLVLLVVVLVLGPGRRSRPVPKVTLGELQQRAAAVEAKLTEQAAEIVRLKAAAVSSPQALADAEKLLAEANALVGRVKAADNVRRADADLRSAHRLVTRLNRELRRAVKAKRPGVP